MGKRRHDTFSEYRHKVLPATLIRECLDQPLSGGLVRVLKNIVESLGWEYASLFLVNEPKEDFDAKRLKIQRDSRRHELLLFAEYPESPASRVFDPQRCIAGLRLSMSDVVEKSKSQFNITIRAAYRNREAFQSNSFASFVSSNYLPSKRLFNYIALPLNDVRGNLLGVLKLENKGVKATRADEEKARDIADIVAHIVEINRRFRLLRLASEAFGNFNSSLDELLNYVLLFALRLVHGSRGDFALASEKNHSQLILRASIEAGNQLPHDGTSYPSTDLARSNFPPGEKVPKRSCIEHLWSLRKSHSAIVIANANADKPPIPYKAADPRTMSELAMLFYVEQQSVGVINIESFSAQYFNEGDKKLLQELLTIASGNVFRCYIDQFYSKFIPTLGDIKLTDQDFPLAVFKDVSDAIKRIWLCDSCVVYLFREEDARLNIVYYNYQGRQINPPKEFDGYNYRETSAATNAFINRSPEYYDKLTEPVNTKGQKALKVKLPFVVLPLKVSEDKIVGVHVIWDSGNNPPIKDHIGSMMRLMTAEAWLIKIMDYRQKTAQRLLDRSNAGFSESKLYPNPDPDRRDEIIIEGQLAAILESKINGFNLKSVLTKAKRYVRSITGSRIAFSHILKQFYDSRRALSTGGVFEVRTGDGRLYTVQVSQFRDDILLVRDASDLIALQRSHEDFLAHLPLPMSRTTEAGLVQWANPAWYKLFGYSDKEEFEGKVNNVAELYCDPKDREILLAQLREKGRVTRALYAYGREGRIWIQQSVARREIENEVYLDSFVFDLSDKHALNVNRFASEVRGKLIHDIIERAPRIHREISSIIKEKQIKGDLVSRFDQLINLYGMVWLVAKNNIVQDVDIDSMVGNLKRQFDGVAVFNAHAIGIIKSDRDKIEKIIHSLIRVHQLRAESEQAEFEFVGRVEERSFIVTCRLSSRITSVELDDLVDVINAGLSGIGECKATLVGTSVINIVIFDYNKK